MLRGGSRFPGPEQGGVGTPWAALTVVLASWFVLARPWLSGRYAVPWDAKAQFLPQVQFMAASWARGESAFWAPYVFSGHPQVADPQSMIFQPTFALLARLNAAPSAWAADATLFVCVLVGAVAMVVWLRDRDLHPAACALAAISFAFGAAMAWRIQHVGQVLSLAYLPIVLLCLDRALRGPSVPYGVAAGAAAAFLVLGRDQVGLLAVYLLAAYVISHLMRMDRTRAAWISAAKPLSIAAVVGTAIVAIPILLTLLIAAESNRPSIDFIGAGRGSLHPALGLTLFAPDVFGSSGRMGEYWGPPSFAWSGTDLFIAQNMGQLYLGALPALLVFYGLFSGALWRPGARFFACALAVGIVYAVGWYTPGFWLMHTVVPGVDLYRRPADAVFVIGFLSSVLAAYSLDHVLRERRIGRRAAIVTVALVGLAFAAMIALAVSFGRLHDAATAIVIPALMFALSAATLIWCSRSAITSATTLTAVIAALLTADLAWSNGPGGATALPSATFEVLEPASRNDTIATLKRLAEAGRNETRRDRVELVGFGFHWPNASLTHGLENTLGYNPVRLGVYSRATGAGDTVGLPDQRGFSKLFPSYRSMLAAMLGLRYIASSVPLETIDPALTANPLSLVAKTADGFIYENSQALPRALFVPNARAADFDAIVASGDWGAFDPAMTVLLSSVVAPETLRRAGTVAITDYQNTRVTLTADSPDGGYVVLNDIYHPWWRVTINGGDAALLRANVLFRAVEVPPGRHTIVMSFAPVRGAIRQVLGMPQKSRR